MSSRTGDKSRFNRLRKQKIHRRMKAREQRLAATKAEETKPERKAA
jgi:hypothetical protein